MTVLAALLAGLALATLTRSPATGVADRLRPTRPGMLRTPSALWGPPAGIAGLLVGGPGLGALLLVAGLAAPRLLAARERSRRTARARGRMLEALGLLAAELRAGRPPADALSAAAEVAIDGSRAVLTAAAGAARTGGDVPAALLFVVPGTERGVDEERTWRSLAACWAVCTDAGHGLAAGVERLEAGLRATEEQRRAVEAELAGPRATAGLLAVLPLAGIGLAAALGADPLHVLLHTLPGLVCLGAGLVTDLLGWLWTRALVRRALDR